MLEPMTKCIFYLCIILSSNACAHAQPALPGYGPSHKIRYPYRDKSGNFGYADENLHIRIDSRYKRGSLFTRQGFANDLQLQSITNFRVGRYAILLHYAAKKAVYE